MKIYRGNLSPRCPPYLEPVLAVCQAREARNIELTQGCLFQGRNKMQTQEQLIGQIGEVSDNARSIIFQQTMKGTSPAFVI